MRSPFAIFRKHQKVAMVVLGVLVMFAFVIGDALSSTRMAQLPPTMMAIIYAITAAIVLGGIGYASGRTKEYATTGLVLGALLGIVLPRFFASPPAVQTNEGSLTRVELQNLMRQKQLANQFLEMAYDAMVPESFRQLMQGRQGEFLLRMRAETLSAFLFQNPSEETALQTFLMNREADRLGIVVSNPAINDYIRRLTSQAARFNPDGPQSLTNRQYREILRSLGVSEKEVFDALRAEIRAQTALILVAPPALPTPAEYWVEYRKLNVRQELDAAAVSVEAFAAEVPDPGEAELTNFFAQYREVYPNQNGPGEPGFRQPQRIRIEYLEADYQAAEAKVLESLEGETLGQEERLAELEKIDETVAEVRRRIDEGTIQEENAKEELEKVEYEELRKLLEAEEPVTRLEFMVVRHYEENKDFQYRSRLLPGDAGSFGLDSPPAGTEDAEAAQSEFERFLKETGGAEPPDETPEKSTPPDEEKAVSPEAGEESLESTSPDTKAPEETEETDNGSAALESGESRFFVSALQPEEKTAGGEEPENNASEPAPEGGETAEEPETRATPEAKVTPRGPEPPPLPEDPPPPRYRPLNEDLKGEIRDQILNRETRKHLEGQVDKAVRQMHDLQERLYDELSRMRGVFFEKDEEQKMPADEAEALRAKISAELKSYAGEHGLVYGLTERLSYFEFSEPENRDQYPVANSRPASASQFSEVTVLDELFNTRRSEIYEPRRSIGGQGNQFALWKTEDVQEHVPESLEEPGLRERVVESWKALKARPEAKKRAEELAELARGSDAELSEALEGMTVTGKEGDRELLVQPTRSFSWLETGLQDPRNPFGQQQRQIQYPDLSTIENPGDDFMQVVFEELEDGEVGVAPNFDRSIFYVVRVRNRSTSLPGATAALRQAYLRENPTSQFSEYQTLISERHRSTENRWRDQFYARYDVRWNISRSDVAANER